MPRPRPRGVGVVVAIAVVYVALLSGGVYLGSGNDGGGAVGPYQLDLGDPTNPQNANAHWHTPLGVYDCDRWLGDDTGEGLWQWPAVTATGGPGHASNPSDYAGLHSHADGVIHMEPDSVADSGNNATLGRYFFSGGWEVSETGFSFLGVERAAGDRCDGEPGVVRWWVNGAEQEGDPAEYKLFDDDVVIVAFLPADAPPPGPPPSTENAPSGESA